MKKSDYRYPDAAIECRHIPGNRIKGITTAVITESQKSGRVPWLAMRY